jgi:hypothetical protein
MVSQLQKQSSAPHAARTVQVDLRPAPLLAAQPKPARRQARMSDAQEGAGGGAGGDVPDSAPSLREVADAPAGEALRTYDTQLGADELLKQFLAEISDVAREAEVLRRAAAAATHTRALLPARSSYAAPGRAQSALLLQAEPV